MEEWDERNGVSPHLAATAAHFALDTFWDFPRYHYQIFL